MQTEAALQAIDDLIREADPSQLPALAAALAAKSGAVAARMMATVRPLAGGPQADALLTAKQAGAALGLGASTVREMAARGEIGCVRDEDSVRFRQEHIQAWIAEHERGARPIRADYKPLRRKGA